MEEDFQPQLALGLGRLLFGVRAQEQQGLSKGRGPEVCLVWCHGAGAETLRELALLTLQGLGLACASEDATE